MTDGSGSRGAPAADTRLPPTVSSPALLDRDADGPSDARFRQMVFDLLHLEAQMREARDRLGAALGISGPGYAILMTIARYQGEAGIRVRDVAARLHVTGAFVTAEVNKLVAGGQVAKSPDPADGRAVLLRLTPAALGQVRALTPQIRAVNDYFFGDLTRDEFEVLAAFGARVGGRSAAAFFDVVMPAA